MEQAEEEKGLVSEGGALVLFGTCTRASNVYREGHGFPFGDKYMDEQLLYKLANIYD
jgi:hypothetical protein